MRLIIFFFLSLHICSVSKAGGVAGKQTIVITKPGGNQPTVLGRSNTGQIIMVTSGSALRTVQTLTSSQAGQGICSFCFVADPKPLYFCSDLS